MSLKEFAGQLPDFAKDIRRRAIPNMAIRDRQSADSPVASIAMFGMARGSRRLERA